MNNRQLIHKLKHAQAQIEVLRRLNNPWPKRICIIQFIAIIILSTLLYFKF
jgi:hypothetical protein